MLGLWNEGSLVSVDTFWKAKLEKNTSSPIKCKSSFLLPQWNSSLSISIAWSYRQQGVLFRNFAEFSWTNPEMTEAFEKQLVHFVYSTAEPQQRCYASTNQFSRHAALWSFLKLERLLKWRWFSTIHGKRAISELETIP